MTVSSPLDRVAVGDDHNLHVLGCINDLPHGIAKKELLARVNRIQGQLEGIKQAIEEERECSQVLQQIAASRGAMGGLLAEIIEGEIRFHVLPRNTRVGSREMNAAESLVEVLHRYLK